MTGRESGMGNRESTADSSRREFFSAALVGLAAATVRPGVFDSRFPIPGSRSIKQSAARWCYDKIPIRDFAQAAKRIGLAGIDLLQPADWDIVREHGLTCSMGYPTD